MVSMSARLSKKKIFLINVIICSMLFNQYVEFSIVAFISLILLRFHHNIKLIFGGIIISLYSIIVILYNDYEITHFFTRGLSAILIIFFYYSIVNNYKSCIPYIWERYCKICYIACFAGLLQVVFSIIFKINIFSFFNSYPFHVFDFYQPPTATLLEAGDFACFLTPCFSYYILKAHSLLEVDRKAWIIFLTIILDFSSLSILGVIVCLAFYYFQKLKKNKFIGIISLIIGLISFTFVFLQNQNYETMDANSRNYKSVFVKFNQSIEALNNIGDISYLQYSNLSTFATFSNLNVALKAPCRILGTGLGTHEDNYNKVFGKTSFEKMERAFGQNCEDAYSLFTRLLSEVGYIGVLLYLLFVYKKIDLHNPISVAICISIIMHLIGNGNYFINGFALFNVMYFKIRKQKYSTTKFI